MRHLAIATVLLALTFPAGATDIWDKAFPGKPDSDANLTPAKTAELAREVCRCIPHKCEYAIQAGLANRWASFPLGRLLAAALEGEGITSDTARAAALNVRECER